jgi:hypothetical protein
MPVIQPITSASSGSAYVPTSRILTINGVSYDLTADRSWTVEVLDNLIATAPLSYNSGTNTISISQSSNTTDGYLSSTDWLTFSSKQNSITLTTTGNSGAATLVGATLNIPEYTLAGLGGFSNPMTSLGDMIYGNAAGAALRRSGNTTTTKMFLSQTGDGTSSAAPQWATAVTSVAMTVPSAFAVSGSPITTTGTLAVTATGDTTQYIAGDGSLVAFPITGQAGTLVREVRNNTGATLTKGTVVYINGALGNKPTVAKALATTDATSAQTFGLIQADIPNNSNGYLVAFGDLDGLDTSALTEGVQLYLSSTTAGGYTITKQYAPNHLVYIGVVTRSHPTQGRIEVRIQNGYELDEIHDVSAQTPSNNDGLFYNSTNSLWENKSIATALGFTPVTSARTLTINDVAFDLSANRSWSVGDFGTW